jgi:uncharacterized lipoprotein YmbA
MTTMPTPPRTQRPTHAGRRTGSARMPQGGTGRTGFHRALRATLRAAALAAAALAAACANGPTPAPLLLTLPPATAAAAPAPAASSADAQAPRLAVQRVAIPEYLVARRVRYRAGASTLAEWPNTFWAERIEIGISREFVAALRAQLPGWRICEDDCGERTGAPVLRIEIAPLDYLRGERRLSARARAALTAAPGGAPLLREWSLDVDAAADTPQAQAQAMGEMLRRLAQQAAAMVVGASGR